MKPVTATATRSYASIASTATLPHYNRPALVNTTTHTMGSTLCAVSSRAAELKFVSRQRLGC